MIQFHNRQWAVILGGSSGFGLAGAAELAAHGMSVFVVHRDLRQAREQTAAALQEIRRNAGGFCSLNVDALSPEGLAKAVEALRKAMAPEGQVRLLLHALACGNVKPIAPAPADRAVGEALARLAAKLGVAGESLRQAVEELARDGADPLWRLTPRASGGSLASDDDFAFTVQAMGTSLLTWVRAFHKAGLFAADARILGLTSEGARRALRGYAPVAAAKAALEAVSRSIALEFAPYGLRCNIIQAGVAQTPALRSIPNHERIAAEARLRNPFGRLTHPRDVAGVILLLATDEAAWINGALIHADGGEHLSFG